MSDIEEQTRAVQGSKHIPELQAFRGLAALIVVVHHCTFYYDISPRIHKLSQQVFNAHAAVVSFFVLSGFVLARSLSRGAITRKTTINFYIKRIFRIYPALFFACLFGLAYLILFHHHPLPTMVSAWWSHTQRDMPITTPREAGSFLGMGNAMPIPIWSLFVELIGSLVLPLIVILFARGHLAAAMVVSALVALSFIYGEPSRMDLGVYLVDFALGASIPFFREIFARLTQTLFRAKAFGFLAFIVLMTVRLSGGWDFETAYHAPIPANLEALAATVLVGIVAARPSAFPLLRHKWTVWTGDISYSLYLLHMPIMGLVAGIGGEILGIPLFTHSPSTAAISLLSCTLLITMPLAALSYRYIEIPGIALGKQVVRYV